MEGTVKIDIPKGYEFFGIDDDNKVVLTKKQPKYPKTYEECCRIVNANPYVRLVYNLSDGQKYSYDEDNLRLYESIRKLLICRNAYWNLYGEEMGLGEPWKPRWNDAYQKKWTINFYQDEINLTNGPNVHFVLAFPSAEMRDAFYENFKDLIEECKELL